MRICLDTKGEVGGDAPAARRTTGGPPVGNGGAESDAPAALQGGVEYCTTVGRLSSAEGSQGGGDLGVGGVYP